jgi:hypothetical protein
MRNDFLPQRKYTKLNLYPELLLTPLSHLLLQAGFFTLRNVGSHTDCTALSQKLATWRFFNFFYEGPIKK